MKKNLKSCIEQTQFEQPTCVLNMNDCEMIEKSGMTPDLKHQRSAHITARWELKTARRIRIPLVDSDLSQYRYLTFSLFAINGEGARIRLFFENNGQNNGDCGYIVTLPISRNGWNDYRIELPFLQSVGAVQGWDQIRAIRLEGANDRSDFSVCLDNLFGWRSAAPQSYVTMPELKGAAMFSKTAAYAVIDRRRIPVAIDEDPLARPFEESGILWLPMAPIAAVIGHRAVADNKANTLSFNYRRKQYAFSGNEASYTVNGEAQALPFKPVVRGGTLFFPSGYLMEFFHWRQCFTDLSGLVVLSNRKNAFVSGRDTYIIQQLNEEITFVHPSGEAVMEDLRKKITNPDKGRLLLLPEEWMAKRKLAKTDATLGQLLNVLKATYGNRTEIYADAPVFANGAPAEADWDTLVSNVSNRLQSFGALFRLTGEKHYAERCAAECEALANLPNWNAAGDLSHTASIGLSIAFAYDWCHSGWSEGRKALVERAMLRNLLRPAVEFYNGKLQMWRSGSPEAAQINCAFVASALALAYVYPETALKVIRHSMRNVLPCFNAYAPDGGHPEGVAAWECATTSLVLMISMLQSATGKDYGMKAASGFAATARFAAFTETSNGAWNFHRGDESPTLTASFGWFAQQYQAPLYAYLQQKALLAGKKELTVLDLIYYSPISEEFVPNLPLDAVYRKAGLVMFRSGWKNDSNLLALHGGDNGIEGNVLNVGSFLLEMGGERFFAPINDSAFDTSPEGKNTLIVNNSQSANAKSEILAARSRAACAYAVIDTTEMAPEILRGKRGILLTQNRQVAVVQDEITLSKDATVSWSAYTSANVISASARTLVLESNGKQLLCKLSGAGAGRFQCDQIENASRTCVSVKCEAEGKFRMAVSFRLLEAGQKKSEKIYDLRPISTWDQE